MVRDPETMRSESSTARVALGEHWDPVEEQLAIATIQQRMFGRPAGPKAIARYILLEPIGGGAMGLVWAAYDPTLDRHVAVKLIRPPIGAAPGMRAQAHAALLREAQAIAGISHPNVVAVFDTGTFDERDAFDDGDGLGVYVVMELVEGPTLEQWLRAAPRSWREVVEVLRAAARGLAAVHRRGLVHRDVKPTNVLVGDPVRLADFGLAAPAPDAADGDSPRVIAGTPGYMAPEQLAGHFDAKSDQFAFCASLWRGLYGRVPAASSARVVGSSAARVDALQAPPNSSVPRWLHAVVARGLRADPGERFADMDELLRALARDPARTRKRWLIATSAAAAAVALGFGLGRPAAGWCDRDPIADVWNDDVAAGIDRQFAGLRVPYARDSLADVRRGLDEYAHAWRERYGVACAAAGSPTGSGELACLDRGLLRMGGLVGMLGDADPAIVERAAVAVDELPRPSECSVVVDAAATGHHVPAALGELERGDALLALGRVEEARDVAHSVLANAEDPRIVAEAELLACRIDVDTNELPVALVHCERAWLAAEAAGADTVAIDALLTAAAVQTGQQSADARRSLELAAAKLRAVEGAAELRLRLAGERVVSLLRTDPPRAAALAADHVAAVEREYGAESTRLLPALNGLALARRNTGDLDGAREIHERALALAERRLGPWHPRVSGVLNNLGANENAAGRPVSALALLQRSLAIKQLSPGWNTTRTATTWANLAEVHMKLGDHSGAVEHARRALALRERAFAGTGSAVADSRQILARALRLAGARDEAHAQADLALAALATTDAEVGGIDTDVRLELAWNEANVGAWARADAGFREVLEASRALAGDDDPSVAPIWLGLAITAASREQWADADDAFAHVQAALADSERDALAWADACVRFAAAIADVDPPRARALRRIARAQYLRHLPSHPALVALAVLP